MKFYILLSMKYQEIQLFTGSYKPITLFFVLSSAEHDFYSLGAWFEKVYDLIYSMTVAAGSAGDLGSSLSDVLKL